MKDDGLILSAWAEAVRQKTPGILATVVKVAGSAYRSPGARMLITENGGRTGSISGGCLEGDVLKKAWWLTGEHAAALRVYDNTSEEDAIWEFGLGCNGIVHVLLERWEPGSKQLAVELLAACRNERQGGVLATVISGEWIGQKVAVFPDGSVRGEVRDARLAGAIERRAKDVWRARESTVDEIGGVEVFVEYIAPPTALLIVGAGHDAVPVVRLAKDLGWSVTVVDGRANYAKPEYFPQADRVLVSQHEDPLRGLQVDEQSIAVLMSHSYPQDSAFLHALHPLKLRYLGILGPRKRTERMLAEVGLTAAPDLHSPVGLDIGADTPEEIALAIVSEIQATLTRHDGGMLHRKPGPIHAERRKQFA
jgi:xanthine dehydrogenase accessory factor